MLRGIPGTKSLDKNRLLEFVRHIPDIFLLVALSAVISNDLLRKFLGLTLFDSRLLMANLAAPLTIAVVLLLWRSLGDIRKDIEPLSKLAGEVVKVLPGEGSIPCSELMRSKSQIDVLTLAGGVTVPLDDEQVVNALFDPKRMSTVRCLIANPFSPVIIDRYERDEPIWKRDGIQSIESRLVWLFNLHERLEEPARSRLMVSVYDSYPMLSIFRADDSVYSSYYAYQLRGHDTPMFLADVASSYGRAVMKHFGKLREASTPLPVWMERFFYKLRSQSECQFGLRYSGVFLCCPDGTLVMQQREDKPGIAHPNQVSVFGGRSTPEESARATAVRELKEETGLRIREMDLRPLVTIPYLVEEEKARCMLCSYFLVENINRDTIVVKEGQGMVCVSCEEAVVREDLTDVPRRILEARLGSGAWPEGVLRPVAEEVQ